VRAGNEQAWIGGLDKGVGVYVAGDAGLEDIRSLMNAENGFEVRRGNLRVADVGMTEKGNVALRLYSPAEGPRRQLVAVGVTAKDNAGGLEVRNPDGKLLTRVSGINNQGGLVAIYPFGDNPAASMEVHDGGGQIAVLADDGTGLASMSRGSRRSPLSCPADGVRADGWCR